MKIVYFKGKTPNFGDELNLWMWPKLMPGFFDDDASVQFIGIGSTISAEYGAAVKKIVFGAGFVAQYKDPPDVHDGTWDVYFVRGPRTAKTLKLAPELAIGDSGILLRTLVDMKRKTGEVVSFMPHFESLERGHWQGVCARAGMQMIDPRGSVENVITALLRSKLVIAEAMHGAIIADAFRIPWVAVLPLDPNNREKWHDWSEALNLTLQPVRLRPSSAEEARYAFRFNTKMSRLLAVTSIAPLAKLADWLLQRLAAHQLKRLAAATPQMSDDRIMDEVTAKMLDKLGQLRRDYADGKKEVNGVVS